MGDEGPSRMRCGKSREVLGVLGRSGAVKMGYELYRPCECEVDLLLVPCVGAREEMEVARLAYLPIRRSNELKQWD